MKKGLIAILIILVISLVFISSCGKIKDNDSQTSYQNSDESEEQQPYLDRQVKNGIEVTLNEVRISDQRNNPELDMFNLNRIYLVPLITIKNVGDSILYENIDARYGGGLEKSNIIQISNENTHHVEICFSLDYPSKIEPGESITCSSTIMGGAYVESETIIVKFQAREYSFDENDFTEYDTFEFVISNNQLI